MFALGGHSCMRMAIEKPNLPVFSFKFHDQGIFNSSVTEHTERKNNNFYEWTDAKFKTIFVNRVRPIRRRRLTSTKTWQFCLDLLLRWRSRVKFHKLLHLTCDVTGQHYRPVPSDVSLLRLSERRRRLKFRLSLMWFSQFNLKLVPVPSWTSERPILHLLHVYYEITKWPAPS